MDSQYQIAQINIGRTVAPLDDPRLAGFVNRLDELNALADRSAGFVWRLQSAAGNATSIQVFPGDPLMIVNMTVWETLDDLHAYVYRSAHLDQLRERKNYFEKLPGPYYAIWWVPRGHIPTVQDGLARIEHLATHGPSAHAFWFGAHFEPDLAPTRNAERT